MQQAPDSFHAVLPPDLLAFMERAALVADRDLDDLLATLERFGRQLDLDLEPVRTQVERAQQRCAEKLVTSLHVREPRAEKRVREAGQASVHELVPGGTRVFLAEE